MAKRAYRKKTSRQNVTVLSPQLHEPGAPPEPLFMDAFILGPLSAPTRGMRAAEKAQDIMYEAWEAPTRKRALALCAQALAVSENCADAYVMLAQESARSAQQRIDYYQTGVAAGRRALGKKFFDRNAGHFWGMIETRPFMRALQGLAMSLWEGGQRDEAVECFWELLRLNPNDNQGNRELLLPRLIEMDRDKDAETLYKRYKRDGMAVWRYSRALLDFRRHGELARAGKSLASAIQYNPHVPRYVLGRVKLPRESPGFHGIGDRNEAIYYATENTAAWRATPGALEWLAAAG